MLLLNTEGIQSLNFRWFLTIPTSARLSINNIKYNRQVKEYWEKTFASQSKHERSFVDRHLRPLREQIQDMRGEAEEERLIRTDMLDQAAQLRLEERENWLQERGRGSEVILNRTSGIIQSARGQTGKMQDILRSARELRQSLRDMEPRLFMDA